MWLWWILSLSKHARLFCLGQKIPALLQGCQYVWQTLWYSPCITSWWGPGPHMRTPERSWCGIGELSIQIMRPVKQSCVLRIMDSMLASPDLSTTSIFVTLSCHLKSMIYFIDLLWKCWNCVMCFLYRVHISQSYRRLVSTTTLYTLILVVSLILLWFTTWEHRQLNIWLVLLIQVSNSLSRMSSEEIMLPRYLKWSTDSSWGLSIFMLEGVFTKPGAGWCITLDFLRLNMKSKRQM